MAQLSQARARAEACRDAGGSESSPRRERTLEEAVYECEAQPKAEIKPTTKACRKTYRRIDADKRGSEDENPCYPCSSVVSFKIRVPPRKFVVKAFVSALAGKGRSPNCRSLVS